LARERLLLHGGRLQDRPSQAAQKRDADARATVEQAGQNHGMHDPEQCLGGRSGDAEQGGRSKRSNHSSRIHASSPAIDVEIESVPRRDIRSMAGDIQLRIRIPCSAELAFSLA
jgi:hypothetical protein